MVGKCGFVSGETIVRRERSVTSNGNSSLFPINIFRHMYSDTSPT